jgi:hypothetical protein
LCMERPVVCRAGGCDVWDVRTPLLPPCVIVQRASPPNPLNGGVLRCCRGMSTTSTAHVTTEKPEKQWTPYDFTAAPCGSDVAEGGARRDVSTYCTVLCYAPPRAL